MRSGSGNEMNGQRHTACRPRRRTLGLSATMVLLPACTSLTGGPTGVVDGRLQLCSSGPHCVSSAETRTEFRIAPLVPAADTREVWRELRAYLVALPRTEVVDERPDYLHLTFTSRWFRFTDDVEFLLRESQGEIAMRSSSRLGYYDFGVNRERLESIRAALRRQKLVN